MSRSTKKEHSEQIEVSRTRTFFKGFVAMEAQSPKMIAKARSEKGRPGTQLRESEYIASYMGRGSRSEGQERERWAAGRMGRRRITRH